MAESADLEQELFGDPTPLHRVRMAFLVSGALHDATALLALADDTPLAWKHLPGLRRHPHRPVRALARLMANSIFQALQRVPSVTVERCRARTRRRRSVDGVAQVDVWIEITAFANDPDALKRMADSLRTPHEMDQRSRRKLGVTTDLFKLATNGIDFQIESLERADVGRFGSQYSGGTVSEKPARSNLDRSFRQAFEDEYRPDGPALDRRLLDEVRTGNPTRVRWLMALGADPQFKDETGKTSLMIACDEQLWAVAEELIRWRRSLASGAFGGKRCYPLWRAIEHGREDFAAFLVDAGAFDEGKSRRLRPVHLAAEKGFFRLLAIMATQMGSKRPAAVLSLPCEDGRTPLHFAAEAGQLATVRWLLGEGVAPSPKNDADATPADLAERSGHLVVSELLKRPPRATGLTYEVSKN